MTQAGDGMTTTTRLHGQDAVDRARDTGAKLSAYADPLEDARAGLAWDSDAVIERLRVDPGLVYLEMTDTVRHVRSQHAARYQQGGRNHTDRTAWCGAVLPDNGDHWGPVEDLTDSPVPLANCPTCLDDGTGTCRRCGGGLPPCAGCDHHAYPCRCSSA